VGIELIVTARILALVGCLTTACGPPSSRVANQPSCPGLREVRGRVVGEATDRGVSDARVTASGTEARGRGEWERFGTTGDDGAFMLCVPRGGEVSIRAEHPDFGLQWTDGDWRGHRYHGIPDRPLRLVLRRGTVLRGRLLGPEAQPLADHLVVLFPPALAQVCLAGPCIHVAAPTDASGLFRFERMVLSHEMRIAWGLHDRAGGGLMTGRLLEADMSAYVADAEAGRPVELIVSPRDLDAELEEIMGETAEPDVSDPESGD